MAQCIEHVTLELEFFSSSPILGIELLLKKEEKEYGKKAWGGLRSIYKRQDSNLGLAAALELQHFQLAA